MKKNLWMNFVLLFVACGLLLTVACATKTVKSEPPLTQIAKEDLEAQQRKAAEELRQQELARQKALEEQRLKAEEDARQRIADARSMFVNEDIYFEFDRARLLSDAQDILKRKAQWLRNNSDVSVVIEGHCDERGTNEYNMALGDRRAQSAQTFLVNLGISTSRLLTVSFGEERPVDTGHTEEAWTKNRRVHFVIQ